MKYMGSKARIAAEILPIILKDRQPNQWYVEPFMGGCNVIDKVKCPRIANDINQYVVEMFKKLITGWMPPQIIDENTYKSIKNCPENYDMQLVGFAGIAMTFGSTWFGTYARNKRGTNYAMEGRGNLINQAYNLNGVNFNHGGYSDLVIPEKSIIYCDPPYKGVAEYKDKKFNHAEFWEWCRDKRNQGHQIFISEYDAPEDFICVWEKQLPTNLNAKHMKKPIEKLFTLC